MSINANIRQSPCYTKGYISISTRYTEVQSTEVHSNKRHYRSQQASLEVIVRALNEYEIENIIRLSAEKAAGWENI